MTNFISNLQKKRCDYNHPDQATSQANSLILLSSGIYTEEERFVFELLQNAVDAHNETQGMLDVKIIIENGFFIFLHNGDAFTERDIEGLCDVGNGNKMNDVKKIGYKGIGFKSVFMRSTNVTVQSGSYCFKFDKSYWDNYWVDNWDTPKYGDLDKNKKYLMPWQIIPIETNPPIQINTKGYNVVTYIKINDTISLEQKIKKLLSSSQFLLFLKSKKIQIALRTDGRVRHKIQKVENNNQVILSTNGTEESRWLIYTNESVKVPSELRGAINADINTPDKLKEVKTFDLSFAIALNERGQLKRLEKAVIYTYLPTSFQFGSEGFPFLVNANFITDAGRQQLHKDSEWNKLIFSKIPSEFLKWMKEITSIHQNYWEVLPKKTYGRNNSLEEIYEDEMQKAINTIAFIPRRSNSQQKVLASRAFMDRMGLSEAISPKALVDHVNRTYHLSLSKNDFIANVWKGSKVLSDYGVFIFDKKKLKGIFEDDEAFINIDVELDIKLIDFLFRYYWDNITEQEELIGILQSTRFLLDEDGMLRTPIELFFPSIYTEQNELAEEDAIILHPEVSKAICSDQQKRDWLFTMGVECLSDITFIKNVICGINYINKDNAIEVVRFLFEVNQSKNIFEEISYSRLHNLKFITKQGNLSDACNLFLGSFYKPVIDIENVYDGDIYISEEYPSQSDDVEEWSLFFRKMGIKTTLGLTYVSLESTKGYSILEDVKCRFTQLYNVGSWGTHFYYHFRHFVLYYAPFILTTDCSHRFQKIIWSSILTKEFVPEKDDTIEGSAGFWPANRNFSSFDKENFITWAFKNIQKFPSSDGQLMFARELLQNTDDINTIAGSYLPVIDIDGEIHDNWRDILMLRNTININDCLTILTKISEDIDNIEQNKERISKVYQRLIELDALSPGNKKRIKHWAKTNLILSEDNHFLQPSELSHITLDGFGGENRVYIGRPSDKGKVIELLSLMGVKIITEESISPQFENKTETDELKKILLGKLSPLALVATGEKGNKTTYFEKKKTLQKLLNSTHFYHCAKISLSYGNNNDVIDKQTFGSKNEFYYTGNLRPANVEPLLTPLCQYLGIKGKERVLFILMIEEIDGIRQNLMDKGYDVSLIEEEPINESGTLKTVLDYQPNISAQERNIITGFKGEIIVYERLVSMGYSPVCPSISTIDDYEKEIIVNGKTYYCKSNYNRWDISFTAENGSQVFLEVKATTTNVGYLENMPISSNEWSMIKECDKSQDKSYIIVRVFGVDSPNQDIYLFKGHLLDWKMDLLG